MLHAQAVCLQGDVSPGTIKLSATVTTNRVIKLGGSRRRCRLTDMIGTISDPRPPVMVRAGALSRDVRQPLKVARVRVTATLKLKPHFLPGKSSEGRLFPSFCPSGESPISSRFGPDLKLGLLSIYDNHHFPPFTHHPCC